MKDCIEKPVYIDRRNSDCIKWDGLEEKFGDGDLVALWVADMDFAVPECVQKALHEYVDKGVIGYYNVPDEYFQAFINWEKARHSVDVDREIIRFSPGVVAGFNWLLRVVTVPIDNVLVMTPVYYPFYDAVENNGRKLTEFSLDNNAGRYSIDFDKLEKTIVKEDVRCMIFCSPHNPIGRVWDREELEQLMEICSKHGVFVISDEIHQDFVYEKEFTSLLSLNEDGRYNEILAVITAPSKTFNIAGAQNSFVMIPDEEVRRRWDSFTESIRVTSGNSFGYIAARAAYESGAPWLEGVKQEIYGNYNYVKETLEGALSEIVIAPLEGTYLMWIDLGAYIKPEEMKDFVQNKCRMAVDYGDWFRGMGTETCIRVNLATRRENIEEVVERIVANLA
mgnify:CR=1 FL=1